MFWRRMENIFKVYAIFMKWNPLFLNLRFLELSNLLNLPNLFLFPSQTLQCYPQFFKVKIFRTNLYSFRLGGSKNWDSPVHTT